MGFIIYDSTTKGHLSLRPKDTSVFIWDATREMNTIYMGFPWAWVPRAVIQGISASENAAGCVEKKEADWPDWHGQKKQV